MSKRHHATRRRSYGRRQRELHKRQDSKAPAAGPDQSGETRAIAIPTGWPLGDSSRSELELRFPD
jgi:hypothetical protein